MDSNGSRDLIIGGALALLLYWWYQKNGGSFSLSGATSGTSGAAGGTPASPSAGTSSGCGCSKSATAALNPVFPIGTSPHIVAELSGGSYGGA